MTYAKTAGHVDFTLKAYSGETLIAKVLGGSDSSVHSVYYRGMMDRGSDRELMELMSEKTDIVGGFITTNAQFNPESNRYDSAYKVKSIEYSGTNPDVFNVSAVLTEDKRVLNNLSDVLKNLVLAEDGFLEYKLKDDDF